MTLYLSRMIIIDVNYTVNIIALEVGEVVTGRKASDGSNETDNRTPRNASSRRIWWRLNLRDE